MRRATLLAASMLAFAGPFIPGIVHAEAPFDFDRTPGKLPKTVVPDSYTIDIVPDLQKLTLTGHEAIDLEFRETAGSITLNQIGLAIGRAVLEDGTAATIAADDRAQTATLHFPHPVTAGKHVLTIDYTGPIPNSPAGIYYDDYKTAAGVSPNVCW